ncbi:MAG: hypothetical protein R3359_09620, partial [Marinirhabdus sp.]|nr:hypothetical protein [Marinirhabdus sp.]
ASYSDHSFPLTTISIPPIENDRSLMLGITTQIRVYGDQQILHDQSGLTVPLLLRSIKKDERLHTVSLIYQLSNSPGWTTT